MKTIICLFLFLSASVLCSAQEITKFNGFFGPKYYQDDRQISTSELENILEDSPKAHELWKTAKSQERLAWLTFAVQIGFHAWQLSGNKTREEQTVPLIGGLVFGVTSLGLTISANNKKKDAILEYNRSLGDSTIFELGPTYNGYGLVIHF